MKNYCRRCHAEYFRLDYYEAMCASCELASAELFLKELSNRNSRDVRLARELVAFWTDRVSSPVPFSYREWEATAPKVKG